MGLREQQECWTQLVSYKVGTPPWMGKQVWQGPVCQHRAVCPSSSYHAGPAPHGHSLPESLSLATESPCFEEKLGTPSGLGPPRTSQFDGTKFKPR